MTAAPARARPPRPRPRPRPPPARASARPTLARPPPPPPSPPIRRGRFAAQAAAAPPATVVPARRGRAPGLRRGREDSNPPPPDAGAAAGPQTRGPAGLTGRAQAPAADDRKTFLKNHRPRRSRLPSCGLGSPPSWATRGMAALLGSHPSLPACVDVSPPQPPAPSTHADFVLLLSSAVGCL
ncbi:formin-like protein 5 [Mustela putorius furo]|uniref:Formin-like protein 5 n=1 Tax=Mustela putorius furo TaxID=9669 RepID=A0A8U0RUM8_MUSPF|nr:formin-like protein 5 [Mustela putorius furo]